MVPQFTCTCHANKPLSLNKSEYYYIRKLMYHIQYLVITNIIFMYENSIVTDRV